MLFFGPLSSLFDFMTYAVMLGIFQAGPDLFRSGWFVESLATQTLVIFAIRTRRVPFFTSHPSLPLALSAVGVVVTGVVLPGLPAAAALGFAPLPPGFFLALLAMVAAYLVLVEFGKGGVLPERADRRNSPETANPGRSRAPTSREVQPPGSPPLTAAIALFHRSCTRSPGKRAVDSCSCPAFAKREVRAYHNVPAVTP